MAPARKLAGFGLLCALCFAVLTLPARIPLQLIANDQLRFSGVSGTIWRASINVISVGGINLSSTQWRLEPLRLLTGQLGGKLKSRWAGGFLEASLGVSIFGTLSVSDTAVNATVAWLAKNAGLPAIDGQARITIEGLEFADNWPTELVANIELDGLSSSMLGAGDQGYIGNVRAAIDEPDIDAGADITATINDAGGPLVLTGFLVLTPPASYALNVKVTPRADASEGLRRNLTFLGAPDAQGAYAFELSGSL